MSMILDALSRAEQERRSENGVVLDPSRYVGSSSIKEERLKKWILIALLVNIVLVAIILAGYFQTDNEIDNAAQIAQPVVETDKITPAAPLAEPIPQPEPANTLLEQKPEQSDNKLAASPPTQESALSLQEEARVNKDTGAPVVKKKKVQNAVKKNPPVRYATQPLSKPSNSSVPKEVLPPVQNSTQDYTALSNLSVADRSALSQYEINVHVYDNNVQNRFVLINMTKYKEGDRLSGGGPLIAAITPEGVILDTGSGKTLLERN